MTHHIVIRIPPPQFPPPEPEPATAIPCPCCGEPISPEGAAFLIEPQPQDKEP